MVDATSLIDPLRPTPLSLSEEEKDEIERLIEAGELPTDWFARHYEAVEKNVFGVDHKKDRSGKPQEQGLGSEHNMTRQSIEAYKKWCKDEPDFERHLAKMEKQFPDSQARRASEAKASPNKYGRR